MRVVVRMKQNSGVMEVEWVTAAFGVDPKNSKRYARTHRISKQDGVVEILGNGVSRSPSYQLMYML